MADLARWFLFHVSTFIITLGTQFKIISLLGQLLSLTLLACTAVVLWGDSLFVDFDGALLKASFTVGIVAYFLITCLYIMTFSHLKIDGYLATMKIIHLILLFFVVNPFVTGRNYSYDMSLQEILCLAPVAFTTDLVYVYLLYKRFSNRFVNGYHVLPKIIIYTLMIYDQITQLYTLMECCFVLLFLVDYLFFLRVFNYNLRGEKKLDFMDLEEYSNSAV